MATILVAEDERDLRTTLCEVLETQGHRVIEAEDGEKALAILQSGLSVDVLITDLNMPKLDGMTLLREIGPPPPVVIVHSAFEYYSPQQVTETAGSTVFRSVRKPVHPPELLAAVSEALNELQRLEQPDDIS